MTAHSEPVRAPGPSRAKARAARAARLAARALVTVVLVAAVAAAATRMLRPPASVHTRAYGTSLGRPGPAGPPCGAAVEAACARTVATRVGVTVAWLPDGDGRHGAGLRSGGAGGHGWATETLRTQQATLEITSNSPAVEIGDAVALPGTTGLTVRVGDAGCRIQLVWSHAGTRYVADARAQVPATARDLAALVDAWHRIRYAGPVSGWS